MRISDWSSDVCYADLCGQVIDAYSTGFTGASGLPMTKPPSGVAETTCVQSPPLGAGIASIGPLFAVVAALPSPPSLPQPPRSSASVAVPVVMNAFMSLPRQFADDRNRHHRRGCAMPFARRKPARQRFEEDRKSTRL